MESGIKAALESHNQSPRRALFLHTTKNTYRTRTHTTATRSHKNTLEVDDDASKSPSLLLALISIILQMLRLTTVSAALIISAFGIDVDQFSGSFSSSQ
jgi:hypothetical protein